MLCSVSCVLVELTFFLQLINKLPPNLVCGACTAVANSVTGTNITCASTTTSKINVCTDGFWKDTAKSADVCTKCTVVTNSKVGTAISCSSDKDSKVISCAAAGFYKKETLSAADQCLACPVVENSKVGTAITCTKEQTSKVSDCVTGFIKTEIVGGADICTAVLTALEAKIEMN